MTAPQSSQSAAPAPRALSGLGADVAWAAVPVAWALALASVFPRLALARAALDAVVFATGALLALSSLEALSRVSRPALLAALAMAGAVTAWLARAAGVGHLAWCGVNTALLAGSALVGGAIGSRVQHPGHLLPACAIAAAADLYSLSTPSMPTHSVLTSERALSLVTVGVPIPGVGVVAPVLGAGDLVFVALVLGVARAHALSPARVLLAGALGLALAGGLSAALSAAVPALVPLAGAYVALVPRAREVAPADRRAARLGVLVALAVLVASGVRLARSSSLPPEPPATTPMEATP